MKNIIATYLGKMTIVLLENLKTSVSTFLLVY